MTRHVSDSQPDTCELKKDASRLTAEGSISKKAQLAVQPRTSLAQLTSKCTVAGNQGEILKKKTHREKIEGESVGRFPPGFFKKTGEAQDPAACGTALAALPAPAGGTRHHAIMIFWPKKRGGSWLKLVEIVVFPCVFSRMWDFLSQEEDRSSEPMLLPSGELNVGKQR